MRLYLTAFFVALSIMPAMAQVPPIARPGAVAGAAPVKPDPLAALAREYAAFSTAQEHFVEAIKGLAEAHQEDVAKERAADEALKRKDWQAAFAAWCGTRPACGLEPAKGK